MSRVNRAKQFAQFDALKGLQDALRWKEYEHERIQMGELSEEKAQEISNIEKNDVCEVKYFLDGHYKTIKGNVKLNVEENVLQIDKQKILLDNIFDITVV